MYLRLLGSRRKGYRPAVRLPEAGQGRLADEDLFGHGDIVAELAELATKGPAKTNIALFAPWGTGKSGIAKLLKPKIEAGNRFAYFDAFKHRETPLRRSFLRAVAKELGKKPDESDRFYKQKIDRRLKEGSERTLLRHVGMALAVGLALMLVVSLLLAWPRTEPQGTTYGDSVIEIFTGLGGLAAFVAAFLGVVVTAVAQGLTVEETTTPMSDDDEFENAFEELASGSGRLVVFVDELDRCSAGDVVETLETLRVFLDVEDCVFIVAADRQALEQALRHRARQETPADQTHPYFSSGGSYIDKIFQCQLSLPPVRPRDMAGFAQTLVKDRGGCWRGGRLPLPNSSVCAPSFRASRICSAITQGSARRSWRAGAMPMILSPPRSRIPGRSGRGPRSEAADRTAADHAAARAPHRAGD